MTASSAQPKVVKNAAKAIIRTDSPAPSASVAADPTQDDGSLESYEHSIFKELYKNIRNINKKISNAHKAESLVNENPNKSLDDLVTARIINKDQKEQVLKLSAQRKQLAQYEEQVATAKKLVSNYRERALADKYKLKEELLNESYKAKDEAVAEAAAKFEEEKRVAVHDALLAIAQFLRLAAARRTEEADQNLDENKALEGVLLQVYSGDEAAVSTMQKIIDGSKETTISTSGETLATTYAQVKAAAAAYRFPTEVVETTEEADTTPVEPVSEAPETPIEGEPTLEAASAAEVPTTAADETAASQDWVKVNAEDAQPTPVVEKAEPVVEAAQELPPASLTEIAEVPSEEAVPAAPTSKVAPKAYNHEKKAWNTPASNPPAESPDGFHQVQRKSFGRGDSFRGRGRGGGSEWRGRGAYRGGNGGGRGRGGFSRGGGRGGTQQGRPNHE